MFIFYSAQCTTQVYRKANRSCACAFVLSTQYNWKDAFDHCKALGARLPEVMTASENLDISNLKVCSLYMYFYVDVVVSSPNAS